MLRSTHRADVRILLITLAWLACLIIYRNTNCQSRSNYHLEPTPVYLALNRSVNVPNQINASYIFLGGILGSGTSLLSKILINYLGVNCVDEVPLLSRLFQLRADMSRSEVQKSRLLEAGIKDEILDSAYSKFTSNMLNFSNKNTSYVCAKNQNMLKHGVCFKKIFPNVKFIFMIRDGRGTVHSIISRKLSNAGLGITDYRQALYLWSQTMERMYSQCLQIGLNHCMPIHYEQLVLKPELWVNRIIEFLDIQNASFAFYYGTNGQDQSSLSKIQIDKSIYQESLNKWVGNIPADVVADMAVIAPILRTLGYDPDANAPTYNKLDITDYAKRLQQNVDSGRKERKNG